MVTRPCLISTGHNLDSLVLVENAIVWRWKLAVAPDSRECFHLQRAHNTLGVGSVRVDVGVVQPVGKEEENQGEVAHE